MFDPFRNHFGPIMATMDYEQIEAQCAAHMSGVEHYTLTASKLFGVPQDNVTPVMRVAARKRQPWGYPNFQQAEDRIHRHDYITEFAVNLFGVPAENITPAMRQAAKNKMYYGMYP